MTPDTARLYKTIGARIRAARKAQSWTQQQLATHTGIPRSSISCIELGMHPTDVHVIRAIAHTLGHTIDQLTEGHTP